MVLISNYITSQHYTGLSKKEKKVLLQRFDSLTDVYQKQEIIHLAIAEKLRVNKTKDSLDLIAFKALQLQDKNLLKLQNQALSKFKNLTSSALLTKLDSAYEADTHK